MKIANGMLQKLFVPALRELGTKKVSGKVAYNCMRTLENCKPLLNAFTTATKNIIDAHAKKDKKGFPIVKDDFYVFPSKDIQEKVVASLAELAKAEVDIDVLSVDVEELFDAEEITAELLFNLKEFVREPATALTKSIAENGMAEKEPSDV